MKKRFFAVFLIIVSLLYCVPVHAYDNTKPFDPKDVTTWTHSAWQECHEIKLAGGTDSTVARSACSYFATSYALEGIGKFKNQLSSDCLVIPEYYNSSYLTVA